MENICFFKKGKKLRRNYVGRKAPCYLGNRIWLLSQCRGSVLSPREWEGLSLSAMGTPFPSSGDRTMTKP